MIKRVINVAITGGILALYGHMLYMTYQMAFIFAAFAGVSEIGRLVIPVFYVSFFIVMTIFGRPMLVELFDDVKVLFGFSPRPPSGVQHPETPRTTKAD